MSFLEKHWVKILLIYWLIAGPGFLVYNRIETGKKLPGYVYIAASIFVPVMLPIGTVYWLIVEEH